MIFNLVFLSIFLLQSTFAYVRLPSIFYSYPASSSSSIKAYKDDDKPALSVGNLLVLSIGIVGVFGTGFIGTFKQVLEGSKQDPSAPVIKSDAGEKNRGALTKLTTREINNKLAQIPIFYVANSDESIHTSDNVGTFFVEKEDAESSAKSSPSLKVKASSLDDVFFTLIQRKTKLGSSFIDGVAATADPAATYLLQPSSKQLDNVSAEWKSTHGTNDIPLFRVASLAFNKENGLEFPLFTRREDAVNAFERLQTLKGKDPKSVVPELQLSSVLDLVRLFSTGVFESRALEVYPSMEAVESAREMMALAR